MKLNFAHLCDSAYILDNNTPAIIGIFSIIKTKELPFLHPGMTVVAEFTPEDVNSHKLEIVLNSPSGKKMSFHALTIGPAETAEKHLGSIFNITNIKFKEEGEHQIMVIADDKELQSILFQIEKIS